MYSISYSLGNFIIYVLLENSYQDFNDAFRTTKRILEGLHMILCEQCGNEFDYGKKVEREGVLKISCPYCRYLNPLPHKRKKKTPYKQGSIKK